MDGRVAPSYDGLHSLHTPTIQNHTAIQNDSHCIDQNSTVSERSWQDLSGDGVSSLTSYSSAYMIYVPIGLVIGLSVVLPKVYRFVRSARATQGPQRGCLGTLFKTKKAAWKRKNEIIAHQNRLKFELSALLNNQAVLLQRQQDSRDSQQYSEMGIRDLEVQQQAAQTKLYELELRPHEERIRQIKRLEVSVKHWKHMRKKGRCFLPEEQSHFLSQCQQFKILGDELRLINNLPKQIEDLEQRKQSLQADKNTFRQKETALQDQQFEELRQMQAVDEQLNVLQVELGDIQGSVGDG